MREMKQAVGEVAKAILSDHARLAPACSSGMDGIRVTE
jgi:hypothetical protein